MFRLLYFYLLVLMMALGISAQAQFSKSPYVMRDPRVDKLVDKQIELNKQVLRERTIIRQGYRILVISTSERALAIDSKSKLMKNYPDQKSYLFYQSPNFKVQFGNFLTMKEAQTMKNKLSLEFGAKIIVIPSQIEIKGERLEAENNQ